MPNLFDLPGPLGTLFNLLVIVLGFGLIVFVHELGHFVAAKWAGIRVLAFSMGFGPVLLSYRKGMGWRKGSSEPDYVASLRGDAPNKGEVSPTEYRLSALPLGGYVKMLGQEDLNPGAVSAAPDSYQNRPVWKRLVVISAGVVVNVITAAALFIVVFMVGLPIYPPKIGDVAMNSPASRAVALNNEDIAPGLLPGDQVIEVNGKPLRSFEELVNRVAMSERDAPITLLIDRSGVAEPILFEAKSEESEQSRLLQLGVRQASSNTVGTWRGSDWDQTVRQFGVPGIRGGDVLASVNGAPATGPGDITAAAQASGGTAFPIEFDRDGEPFSIQAQPERELMADTALVDGEQRAVRHLLGLAPLLRVSPIASEQDVKQGLRPGDVFLRVGELEYPGRAEAIARIQSGAGGPLEIEVERDGQALTMMVQVGVDGRIGFSADSTASSDARVGGPLRFVQKIDSEGTEPAVEVVSSPASALVSRPGTRIVRVGETDVASLADVIEAIGIETEGLDGATEYFLPVLLELPLPPQPDGSKPTEERVWTLSAADVDSVRTLGWQMPEGRSVEFLFESEQIIDKAEGPIDAIRLGIAESKLVMTRTYLTFLRLFQGTVKVEHLKGPVGITHIGTMVAREGPIKILFFMALISINLAVINFLPLPIVDGGQFLMLLYEGIRGKPIPIAIQSGLTLAGLLMVGSLFLLVTFHDIRALFGA